MTMEMNQNEEVEVEEESQTVLPLQTPFSLPSEALAALHRYAAVPVQSTLPPPQSQPTSHQQQFHQQQSHQQQSHQQQSHQQQSHQQQQSFLPQSKLRPDSGVPNARLFIGNLPVEKTSKAELEGIFSRYGTILEVSLKASYGFIQYETAEQCS